MSARGFARHIIFISFADKSAREDSLSYCKISFDYLFMIHWDALLDMTVLFFVFFMVSRRITEHLFLFFLITTHTTDRLHSKYVIIHYLLLKRLKYKYIYQSPCSGLELMLRDMPFIKSGAYLDKFKLNTIYVVNIS